MLILTRRQGEKILIGNEIEVSVVNISGNQVSIGIDAPNDVEVDREEIRIRKNASMDDEIENLDD